MKVKFTRIINLIGALGALALAIAGTYVSVRHWTLYVVWGAGVLWLVEALYKLSLGTRKTVLDLNLARVLCPNCNEPMPTVRAPRSFRQAMLGGWTCPKCGCKMDKWGNSYFAP